MSWGVKFTSDTRSLGRVAGGVDQPTWEQIGQAAVRFIVRETQAGQDMDGQRFKPYSAEYKALRAAAGYSTTPDLTVTGQMLNAVDVVATTSQSVTIGVHRSTRASGSALATMARRGQPSGGNPFAKFSGPAADVGEKVVATHATRPWFGFGGPSSKRRGRIITEAIDIYREALKRLRG